MCTQILTRYAIRNLGSKGKLEFSCVSCHRVMSGTSRFQSYLVPYSAPAWAEGLTNIPHHKVQLGHLGTPIHRWYLPGIPDGFELYIKRDDMTGSTLSGNKVRKLEFLFADAVKKGCTHVITCGGVQSNHCRATAVAAAQLGMKCHLVLRTGVEDINDLGCSGNLFLNRMVGADKYIVPKVAPYLTHLKPRMEYIAKKIKDDSGEDSRLMPVGGSDEVGFYGYLEGYRELIDQGAVDKFDDVVFACGSGGTGEGLAAGNYLTGSQFKIHGVAVCDDAKYFNDHANEVFAVVGLVNVKAEDTLDIIEGYKGKGYGISTQEELDYILEVGRQTGIILDPVYTGKAVRGMIQEMSTNPDRFKGRRVLYIHTGGVFGAYDGRLDSSVLQQDKEAQRVCLWNSLDNPPF